MPLTQVGSDLRQDGPRWPVAKGQGGNKVSMALAAALIGSKSFDAWGRLIDIIFAIPAVTTDVTAVISIEDGDGIEVYTSGNITVSGAETKGLKHVADTLYVVLCGADYVMKITFPATVQTMTVEVFPVLAGQYQ